MKKLLIMSLVILPILLLMGCGRTPEEKAAANLAKGGFGFMQDIVEVGKSADKGEITDEEASKQLLGKYADFIGDSADGTEDELTNEEKDMLHDMFADPEKIEEIIDEALEEENE